MEALAQRRTDAAHLGLLAVTVGLPYFMLATTGPLIQAWYARRFHGSMPYRLYALRTPGRCSRCSATRCCSSRRSERTSRRRLVVGLRCVHRAVRHHGIPLGRRSGGERCPRRRGPDAAPPPRALTLWLLLPATASVLLLAITNHLSANVAAIPFLWVLPLIDLPADLHPLLRRRAAGTAQPVPATAGGGAGQHGLRHGHRFQRHVPIKVWCRCSRSGSTPAAWYATGNWCG